MYRVSTIIKLTLLGMWVVTGFWIGAQLEDVWNEASAYVKQRVLPQDVTK